MMRFSALFIAAAFGMCAMAQTAAAQTTSFGLNLSGNEAARYKATCQVETDNGTKTVAFSGKPPVEESFEGRALSCRITQTAEGGRLDIELRSTNGNVSRMSTSGPDSVITLSIQ